jgi:hypothetical protein
MIARLESRLGWKLSTEDKERAAAKLWNDAMAEVVSESRKAAVITGYHGRSWKKVIVLKSVG